MSAPQITRDQVLQVSRLVADFIEKQRQRYAPAATPLTPAQRRPLSGFFLTELLDQARVLVLKGARVSNPPFYPMLAGMGFTHLPDFSVMAAITFCDVVVSHEAFTDGLLFHELVHVEQYRQLGISRFAELYVRGFLRGGGYDGIPLEVNAYVLGGRFDENPHPKFSVEEEVRQWITHGRF